MDSNVNVIVNRLSANACARACVRSTYLHNGLNGSELMNKTHKQIGFRYRKTYMTNAHKFFLILAITVMIAYTKNFHSFFLFLKMRILCAIVIMYHTCAETFLAL